MKVNVVYTGRGDNGILDRLAIALSESAGWAYNRYPLREWDWNYFICYVEYGEKFSDWHDTPVAAWFTHLEKDKEYKRFWWELAAERVDLRITAARQYLAGLEAYGPAAVCPRPAVDGQFKPQKRKANELPRVGVSGYVHPGERKGARLVAQLCGSDLVEGGRIEMTASGVGWPCHCYEYDWKDLPAFYNSLDVLLCTSSIEGVPMPPLEALACGVKVVIPRGVGLLDDLPEVPGIERYTAGDFGTMYEAIMRALEVRANRDDLRAVVTEYNAANWAADHELILSHMLAQGKAAIESDRHGKRGALYVAYGEQSRKCALGAIASFRKHMPGVEVAVVSTEALGPEDVFIPCDDVDIGGRFAKTKIYELAPKDWQYVLYLDSDTEVVAPIGFLYETLIDGWDMVICKNPAKYHVAREMKRSDNHDECDYTFGKIGTSELIQLNGGVFAFQRNQRTQAFFKDWHEEWQRYGKRDQGALLRALFQHPVKLYVLGNEWNTITRYQDASTSAGILHYPMTARRWRGKVVARSDSKEAWAAVEQFQKEGGK